MAQQKLSLGEKTAYGLGAIGKDMGCGIIFTYLMIFYTDVLGLEAAFVGTLFFFARFWDAFNDPLMGVILQNTKTRWGKFRPWLMIGTLVNVVVLVVMFTDWGLSGTSLYVFASVMYILWGMTYTIMDIPYWAMLPNLTSDPAERNKIAVIPRICATIGGTLIIATLGLPIMKTFFGYDTNQFDAYTKFAWLIAIVFTITIIITCMKVTSADRAVSQASERRVRFKDVLHIVGKNDQLLVAVATILLWNAAGQVVGVVQLYYFKYVLGNEGLFPYFAGASAIANVGGLFIYPFLVNKLRKQHVFMMALVMPFIAFAGLFVLSYFAGSMSAGAAQTILLGSGFLWAMAGGLQTGIVTVVLADVVDYGEYKLGTRDESVIFSLQTLLVKLTSACGALIVGFALSLCGYVQNSEVQTESTINSIRYIMCGLPLLFAVLSFIVFMSKYKLNRHYMKRIQAILSLRREGKDTSHLENAEVIDPATGRAISLK